MIIDPEVKLEMEWNSSRLSFQFFSFPPFLFHYKVLSCTMNSSQGVTVDDTTSICFVQRITRLNAKRRKRQSGENSAKEVHVEIVHVYCPLGTIETTYERHWK